MAMLNITVISTRNEEINFDAQSASDEFNGTSLGFSMAMVKEM